MQIELSGKSSRADGRESTKIEAEDFFLAALEAARKQGSFAYPVNVVSGVFKSLLPYAEANQIPASIMAEQIDERWMAVRWDRGVDDNPGFLFGYRESTVKEYEYFPVQEGIVNPGTGDLLIPFGTQPYGPQTLKLFFPAEMAPWPYPLLAPLNNPLWAVAGIINGLLKPGNDNPLTALLGARDAPVRFAAQGIVNRLETARAVLQTL